MVDILLIQPPVRDFYLTQKRTIPYGLASIAASLQKNGFSVEILDALAVSKSKPLKWPEEMSFLTPYYGKEDLSPFGLFHHFKHFGYSFGHVAKLARDSGASLIGISSLFTAYSAEAFETANEIKRFTPNCPLVMGGHHPTTLPEQVLSWDSVDFVIRGEGETAMPLLATALQNGWDEDNLKTIPGLCFRLNNGKLHIDTPTEQTNLDEVPPPMLDLIHPLFYKRHKKGAMVVTASRGCPLTCSYCSFGAGSVISYRKRRIPHIIKEIEYGVACQDVRFIDFEDENLSLDKSWFMALLHEIKNKFGRLNIELRAMNGLYPPALDEDIIRAMQSAGFKTLNLSLGSTNRAQLARFKRPDVSSAFEKALFWAEKYAMDAVGYIIAGAPDQQANASLADLLYLADKQVLAGLSVFYPSPGSLDYMHCKKQGLLPDSYSLMRASTLPISHTTSRLESVTLLRLARILNFLKALKDDNIFLPTPEPFDSHALPQLVGDRKTAGIKLIQWFLADGQIRGVTRTGEIYVHNTSVSLTKKFLEKLDLKKLKGVKDSRGRGAK